MGGSRIVTRLEVREHLGYTGHMERRRLNPHDHLFRFAFAELAVAQDFVARYLPAEISREVDADTLTAVEGSFIDTTLDKHLSDALFRVRLRNRDDEGLVYILIEHKSYPDRMTARPGAALC